MTFSPIAIVGRGCVLPGTLTPNALWQAVIEGRDLVSSAPDGYWGIDHSLILSNGKPDREKAVTDRGGYVSGFESQFDAARFDADPDLISGLDPMFRWLLHSASEALREASPSRAERSRAGLVLGNLSYPTRSLDDLAAAVWSGGGRRFENRFCSGYPAHLTADLLGLTGEALTLDAACASSLYALRIACDRLNAGEADMMLAAATNHADDLFLHVGFTALQALSPSGQSRPFNRGADGLLPAHGAACVALQRLEDAVAEGRTIHGVIRGIGLSNDGRAGGFLAPDRNGQVRAMQAAYAMSGIDPASISLVECHATGTAVGDGAEIDSMGTIYGRDRDLPLGSLKSNMGHLITVAGLAGLLKVTGAMAAGKRPPTLHADPPVDAFAGTAFRPLTEAEGWEVDGPRRAGINAFGFGGNNAHLIVEEWQPERPVPKRKTKSVPLPEIAVSALGVVTGAGRGKAAFMRRLAGDDAGGALQLETAELPLRGLRYPPKDMQVALGQQALVMEAAFQVSGDLVGIAPERVGCLIGMGCDPEIARYALRLRDHGWRDETDARPEGERACPVLEAAGVIGSMPNIPANRLTSQFDWRAFGYTVSAEELSGTAALRLAAKALAEGEADAVVVGAVEVTGDRVHEQALKALMPDFKADCGDAAVVMVLRRAGEGRELARIDVAGATGDPVSFRDLTDRAFGHCHAASGLLQTASAVLAVASGRSVDGGVVPGGFTVPEAPVALDISSITGRRDRLSVLPLSEPGGYARKTPLLRCFRGENREDLARRCAEGVSGGSGPFRLAVTADSAAGLTLRLDAAVEALQAGEDPAGEGLYFGAGDAEGELAFVFPGAAAAYSGMGRRFFDAFPSVARALTLRHPVAASVAADLYRDDRAREQFDQLKGCALLCQGHAIAARQLLGLRPQAVIGLSSGETNGLFAMEAWRDMDAMFSEIAASDMYGRYLTGAFESARESWGLPDGEAVNWVAWRLIAPVETVRAAVQGTEHAVITIINTDSDCVVAGAVAAVRKVVEIVKPSGTIDLGHPMVVHCAEMGPYAETWRDIHSRRTHAVEDVRFYANHTGKSYRPTRKSVADRLTGQALECIDFPRTIRQAHADGVRCFLELGPRDTSTQAIRAILGDAPHVAVAFDSTRRDGPLCLTDAAARLFAEGYLDDPSGLIDHLDRLAELCGDDEPAGPLLSLPLHWPPVKIETTETAEPSVPEGEIMVPAPALPRVTSRRWEPVQWAPVDQTLPSSAPAETGGMADQTPAGIIAEVHRQYIARQTAAYNDFLAIQARLSGEGGAVALQTGSVGTAAVAAETPAIVPAPAKPVPAVVPTVSSAPEVRKPSTVRFDRKQLEKLASGRISEIFGPLFEQQDGYRVQVRMPEPPLLLVDRVTALEGEAGSMKTGYIETETDVRADEWYMHRGAMTPGAVIESGQADLLLISWLGIDFLNRGKRAYRLLGCELTFHEGGLPEEGDVLRYGIHVDGHAKTGDVRLFFFHYDCHIGDRLLLSVREGQAGFFTPEELANSGGVLWDAEDDEPLADVRLDRPYPVTSKRSFSADEITALLDGDALTCFGAGFEAAGPHHRTPAPPSGRMRMIDHVTEFDPDGGPWERGYMKAIAHVAPDHWFYDGHFLNDPCMPGTLMADAALQALALTMSAYGYTLHRDGWRFEPMPEEAFKFVCRGQVTPEKAHELTYEVFVEELRDGDIPVIRAALLCRSDGFKVFQCRRFSLRLVPDWPYRVERLADDSCMVGTDRSAPGDYEALMACAWGAPSSAFGEMYRRFDGPHQVPRLPGPPYHFITRIREVDCPSAKATVDGGLVAEYQPPTDAWYFRENGAPVMPYGVLMEVLLQPCGWLASYMGFALADQKLAFRNLDGDGAVVHRAVRPGDGLIETRTVLTRFAKVGVLTVVFFRVEATIDGEPLMEMNTSFGFFTGDALANQSGLSASDADRARLAEPCDVAIDLENSVLPGRVPVAAGMYRMVDEVTGFWPEGGEAGIGRIRGRQSVDPRAWYFKAHFFQDPVQPGSLGIEALVQLLQMACRLGSHDEGFADPVFEPFAFDEALVWKYRGQVLVHNRSVESDLDITGIVRDGKGVLVQARGSLWVDGMRIYQVDNLAVRIVERQLICGDAEALPSGIHLDSRTEPWITDHCPTHTKPALPFMSLADLIAGAALARAGEGMKVLSIEDMRVYRWAIADPDIRIRPDVTQDGNGWKVQLYRMDVAKDELLAEGRVLIGADYSLAPDPLPPLGETTRQPDPYELGCLFHGPAFRILDSLDLSAAGASAVLDPGQSRVSYGMLNPCLLDGLFHAVPHDSLKQWFPDLPAGLGYPVEMLRMTFHDRMPESGAVHAEIRAERQDGKRVYLRAQLVSDGRVIADALLAEEVLPQGPLGSAPPEQRKAFLGRREAVPGMRLSTAEGEESLLDGATVMASNWFPGTLETVYGIDGDMRDLIRGIAIREHVAALAGVHPSEIEVNGNRAICTDQQFTLTEEWRGNQIRVRIKT